MVNGNRLQSLYRGANCTIYPRTFLAVTPQGHKFSNLCRDTDGNGGRIHMNETEISQIDTRFETFRLRDKNREKILLASILEQGIRGRT